MHRQLVAGAWVGFNDGRVTLRSDHWGQGAHSALPVVGDFFRNALRARLIDPHAPFRGAGRDRPGGRASSAGGAKPVRRPNRSPRPSGATPSVEAALEGQEAPEEPAAPAAGRIGALNLRAIRCRRRSTRSCARATKANGCQRIHHQRRRRWSSPGEAGRAMLAFPSERPSWNPAGPCQSVAGLPVVCE
jgi:hypothetical protein